MKIYKLKTGYKEFIKALMGAGKEVIAPVNKGKTLLFGKPESTEDVIEPENYINTVRSAKEFMFPITEPVIGFSYNNKELKVIDVEPEVKERIIIGLRPCDASAFTIIDDIFNYEYKDEFYNKRRISTVLVSVACEKNDDSCFCTSVGLKPDSTDGSDILLKKNVNGSYLAFAGTEKGLKVIDSVKELFEEVIEIIEENPIYREIEKKVRKPLDTERAKTWLDGNFDNPLWDTYASRCLGCASCAYLCPTCHCFDLVDEMKYNHGLRRKNWDACQFPVFTVHASGHNPRDKQSKRYRQRVMHKFKYYNDRFNKTLCTGCGRCVRACPVNLDIYQVVAELTQ